MTISPAAVVGEVSQESRVNIRVGTVTPRRETCRGVRRFRLGPVVCRVSHRWCSSAGGAWVAGVAVTHRGDDLKWVESAGELRRVPAIRDEEEVRVVASRDPGSYVTPVNGTNESLWTVHRIAAGDAERVGSIPPTSADERRSPANLLPR